MNLDFYLDNTGDVLSEDLEQIDEIFKATTLFGNTIYWDIHTDEIERMEWKVPKTDEIRTLFADELNTMSQYYLKSYGEKFDTNGDVA